MMLSSKVKLAFLVLGIGSGSIQACDVGNFLAITSLNLGVKVAEAIPVLNTVGAPLIQSGKYYVDENHREPFSEIFKKNFKTVYTGVFTAQLLLFVKSSDYRTLSLGTHVVLGGCATLFGAAWMSNREFGKQLEKKTQNADLAAIRRNQEQEINARAALAARVAALQEELRRSIGQVGADLGLFRQAFAQFERNNQQSFLGINNQLTLQARLTQSLQLTLQTIQSTMDSNHVAIMQALNSRHANHNNNNDNELD